MVVFKGFTPSIPIIGGEMYWKTCTDLLLIRLKAYYNNAGKIYRNCHGLLGGLLQFQ